MATLASQTRHQPSLSKFTISRFSSIIHFGFSANPFESRIIYNFYVPVDFFKDLVILYIFYDYVYHDQSFFLGFNNHLIFMFIVRKIAILSQINIIHIR